MTRHASLICGIGLLFVSSVAANDVVDGAVVDGTVCKRVVKPQATAPNLLQANAWRGWGMGFEREDGVFVCRNGQASTSRRGASQSVMLQQKRAAPIVATAWSRSENVTGGPDNNYALYLDIVYTDGDHLWGQAAPFDTGSHDWQERRVVIVPEKPVATVAFNLLLRGHGGVAWFRNPKLQVVATPTGAVQFDGIPVAVSEDRQPGFQVRDVAADSDVVAIGHQALNLTLETVTHSDHNATFYDVELRDTSGRDRAVTLYYCLPVATDRLHWHHDPRHDVAVTVGSEYTNTSRFRVGANGRLSKYPLGAVSGPDGGRALAIDMARPAFFRIGYHAGSGELYLAYDVALTPEKPTAKLRFVRFSFAPAWGFRSALARYCELFPDAFECRTSRQGLWMPFAKISQVEGWQDFGFRFKEGNNETAWDDAHDIVTFRYTEPMTWWMRMPKTMPRTLDAAKECANQLATEKGLPAAKALMTSGFHDSQGRLAALLRDEPWCDGAVWSINSMPGIAGETTDFKLKWNPTIRARYYGPKRAGDLDGEYIDSSEGYVTAQLDMRRDHFATAATPLCFSIDDHQPGIFRGLIVFEYVRAIAKDVHAENHLMMANSTPSRLCWLAPLLDVMGTETNWNPNGHWQPMSDTALLYRRALCKAKPFCFLMNTRFEDFSHAAVEKYMKRALAYGMFPGFFSHNASQGHYFTRPELYNRDRSLFRKYIPLCRRVAEAGWQPITQARCSDAHVHIENFGNRYFTVLNDGESRRSVKLHFDRPMDGQRCRELVTGRTLVVADNSVALHLDAEDVAVVDIAVQGQDSGHREGRR